MKPSKSSPFRSHSRISTVFTMALLAHFAASSASALTYYWDNDGITAGFGTAAGTWAAPTTTGDAAQGFSESATGATLPVNVTTTTADTVNFGNAATGLATGSIAVSGTVDVGTVNFASGSGPITLSGGTISLGGNRTITAQNHNNTIGSAITLDGNGTISFNRNITPAAQGTLTVNGQISGSGNLTFTTPNVASNGNAQLIILGAANTWTGTTTITTGNSSNTTTIRAGVNDALPTSTVLTLTGGSGSGSGRTVTFDLNGKNQTLAGLSNSISTLTARNQRVSSTAAATLTINNSSNYTFGGAGVSSTFSGNPVNPTAQITGAVSIVKNAAGTFTLLGAQTYTGTTSVNAGKLVGVVGGHHQSSGVNLSSDTATYGVSITDNTKKWTCKSLATTAAGTLEFNFGAIAPSTSVSPLTVTNAADFSTTPLVSVVVTASPAPGTYPLMTWGTMAGTAPTTANLTVSQLPFGSSAELQVSGNTLNLVITSSLTYAVKDNNTDTLNLGSSWVGGTAPGTTALAKWNSTVTSANSTVLGADLTWPGMVIENPNGLVTIGAGNTLTLGSADNDIDMSAATADLTLNCPLTLGAANVWDVAASRTLTLGGPVSGAFDVSKLGDGTLQLSASNLMPDGVGAGNLALTGTLDLKGNSDTINGLSGSGVIDNTGLTTSTLTAGANDQTSTFSGILQNSGASLNLVKTGSGTLTLGGANTLSGAVNIMGGTLAMSNIAPLDNVTGITMSGGTTLRPGVANVVVSPPITIGATGTTVTITGHPVDSTTGSAQIPVTLDGAISGDGDVVFTGIESTNDYSRINLNAASNYAGSTLITTTSSIFNANLFLSLGVENALPTTTVVTLDGGDGTGGGRFCEINLNGNNQTLAGLTNVIGRTLRSQEVYNTSTTAATLTINNAAPSTYTGKIGGQLGPAGAAGDNLGLTKGGVGTFTISGANTYTGATTITGGTLTLGALNTIPNASAVLIGNGILNAATTGTETAGTLDVTGAAAINVASGAVLAFLDSSSLTWSGTLNITGAFASGSSLRFGDGTGTGLTPAQLLLISATGFTGFALDGSGYLTATSTGGYSTWQATNGTVQTINLDHDSDGVSNGVEYFLGGNTNTTGFTALPAVANSSGTLSITWTKAASYTGSYGTDFWVETSATLTGTWAMELADPTPGFTVTFPSATEVKYTFPAGTKNFARLKVTGP